MQEREKQIEEMALDLYELSGTFDENYIAERLYEMGYRKQIEGEWIKRNHSCYCSICGGEHGFAFTTGSAHNYCPNCGAHMRKEDEGK